MDPETLIPVIILAVVDDDQSGNPIVVLYDHESNRVLPIWIGDAEARAIVLALGKTKQKRPQTHALLVNVVGKLGAVLDCAVIDGLKANTYYASLVLQTSRGAIKVDARPSDAIAIAVVSERSLFVTADVFEKGSHSNPFPAKPEAYKRTQRALENLSGENLKKLQALLEKARQREAEA